MQSLHSRTLKSLSFPVAIALAGTFLFTFGACKPPAPVKPGDVGDNMMRRRAALWSYKDGKWKALTNVYAGEKIVVTGKQDITHKGKTTTYAIGKTTDGKSGLVNPNNLALSAVVITGEGTSLYRRNNAASGKGRGANNVKTGSLAFVLERKAEGKWLSVVSGPGPYFKGWLAADQSLSTDTTQIAAALQLAGIRSALGAKNLDEKKLEEIRKDLENLTGKPEPFASTAQELIKEVNTKIEEIKNKPADTPAPPADSPDGPPADG